MKLLNIEPISHEEAINKCREFSESKWKIYHLKNMAIASIILTIILISTCIISGVGIIIGISIIIWTTVALKTTISLSNKPPLQLQRNHNKSSLSTRIKIGQKTYTAIAHLAK